MFLRSGSRQDCFYRLLSTGSLRFCVFYVLGVVRTVSIDWFDRIFVVSSPSFDCCRLPFSILTIQSNQRHSFDSSLFPLVDSDLLYRLEVAESNSAFCPFSFFALLTTGGLCFNSCLLTFYFFGFVSHNDAVSSAAFSPQHISTFSIDWKSLIRLLPPPPFSFQPSGCPGLPWAAPGQAGQPQ